MISHAVFVLIFAAAIGSGLVAGIFFAFSSFVMAALGRLPSDHGIADGHTHDSLGAFYLVAFFDLLEIAEQHGTDLVFFKVEREAANAVRKFEQLARHYLFEPVDLGDTVADLDHGSDLVDRHARIEILDLRTNDFVDLVCFYCFHFSLVTSDK